MPGLTQLFEEQKNAFISSDIEIRPTHSKRTIFIIRQAWNTAAIQFIPLFEERKMPPSVPAKRFVSINGERNEHDDFPNLNQLPSSFFHCS